MRYWILATVVLASLCTMGAGKKNANSYMISFHIEGTEAEAPKFSQPVRLGSEGKVYYFSILPTFTNRDIAWFYPFVSKDGKSYGAAFQLKPTATKGLQAVTLKTQGKLLGARIVDAPLTAVMIDRPIEDGVLVVWSGLSKKHLQMFQKQFPHVEDLQKLRSRVTAGQ